MTQRGVGAAQFLAHQRHDDQLSVLRHDLETVVEDRHGAVHVQLLLALDAVGDRRGTVDLCQPQQAEQANPGPAHVELPLAHRQLGRVRIGVVVVVQLFATDEDAPGHEVGRRITAFEVAIADRVTETVDHTGGPERNPDHLHGPHGEAERAEQRQVDQQHQHDAGIGKTRIEVALDPVVRAVLAIDAQGFLVLRLLHVQLGALAHDRAQPLVYRAVRVVGGLAFGVVLAMDGSP